MLWRLIDPGVENLRKFLRKLVNRDKDFFLGKASFEKVY